MKGMKNNKDFSNFSCILFFINGAILIAIIPEFNMALKIVLGIIAVLDFMFVIYLLGKS